VQFKKQVKFILCQRKSVTHIQVVYEGPF